MAATAPEAARSCASPWHSPRCSAAGFASCAHSFSFAPGRRAPGGKLVLDIGTAGSATMRARGVDPAPAGLTPLQLENPGPLQSVRGVALSSHLGARRVSERMARGCIEDLRSGATVDRHLADQLVPFAALAAGRSVWIAPRVEVEGIGAGLALAPVC